MPYKEPGKNAIWKRANRVKNHEKVLQKERAYRATHPKPPGFWRRYAAKKKVYNLAHLDQARIRNERWIQAHPEHARECFVARAERRRVRKLQAPKNDLTAAQWRAIKNAFEHRCAYCGQTPKRLEQDHITPLSKGGSHTASNIVPACRSCNARKGTNEVPVLIQPLPF